MRLQRGARSGPPGVFQAMARYLGLAAKFNKSRYLRSGAQEWGWEGSQESRSGTGESRVT